MMRSHYASEVSPKMDGEKVELAGWAHEIRNLGKLRFIVLRDRSGLVQVTAKKGVASDEIFEEMGKITVKETLLRIEGKVKAEKQAPKGFEIVPLKIEVIGPVTETIPFELTGKVPAEIDVRLDNRFVDLRRLETQAIFKIRSEMLRIFREILLSKKFQEMTPPCIVAAATEGGTDLFEVQYFEKKAYLAQSPQLYKQLAVIGGMDRVFMTIPVFRAEKHNTTAHLNEVLQMDIEMGFADHDEVMGILCEVLVGIIGGVKQSCAEELKLLGQELKVPEEVKKHTYSEIVELLNGKGEKIEWGEDFTKEHEKKMVGLLGEEAFFITEWPTEIRAFYSMPVKGNERVCNAFDLMYRGMEVASGAQRVHVPEILVEQLKKRGLKPKDFEFYVRAFRMGAPPHAGWSIGAERLCMQLCGRENIRECALFPRDRVRLTP